MTIIQDRAALVYERKRAVLDHCMCANFSEDKGYYYVTYPEGYFPNGIRASKGGGKWVALGHMLVVMERHWKESFPGGNGMDGNC